jgi:hypothetical protein
VRLGLPHYLRLGANFSPKSVFPATLANFADGLQEFEADFANSSMSVAALPLT